MRRNLSKIANTVFIIGVMLMIVQVFLISMLDFYNQQLARIDTSITSLSKQLVVLDNYIVLYKSPTLLTNKVTVYKPKIYFINPTLDKDILSYEFNSNQK